MVSYAVTGASRGIGFELVNQLSAIESNTVFALVRNAKTSTAANELAKTRTNLHVLEADITSRTQLQSAADAISKITPDVGLDVLIQNAAWVDDTAISYTPADISTHEEALSSALHKSIDTNVLSIMHTTDVFIPLILKAKTKKVVVLTSGVANVDFIRQTGMAFHIPYSMSKAAVDVLVAKYAALYKEDGVVVVGISPGWVNTETSAPNEEQLAGIEYMKSLFGKVKPGYEGRITPEQSVRMMMQVIAKADADESGRTLSHNGRVEKASDWL